MGRPLSSVNFEEMRITFVYSTNDMSLHQLHRIYADKGVKVPFSTLANRASKENWVKQRESYKAEIDSKIRNKMATDFMKTKEKLKKIAETLALTGSKKIFDKLKSGEYQMSIQEYDKLARLIVNLSGETDRPNATGLEFEKPLEEMTDEELKIAESQIIEAGFELIGDDDGR